MQYDSYGTYYYSFRLRVTPILYLLVAAMFLALPTIFLLWDTWVGVRAASPDYTGIMLAFRLIVFAGIAPIIIVLSLAAVRSTWFYLYRYRYTDSTLEAFDPILRKGWLVCLDEVSKIRTFVVFGQSQPGPSRMGHLLETKGGYGVKLSEALPIWPDIANRCVGVTVEERPMPWWEVRR